MITLWIVIQTIVDFLILVAVLLYVFDRRKRQEGEQNIELKKSETQELIKALDRLITESERSSINISDKALLGQKKSQELLDQLEIKNKILQKEVKKAESVLEKLREPLETKSEKNEPAPPEKDKYSEAVKLAKNGLNAEEISKQLDLPKGEVELVIDLPLRNANRK